MWLRQLAPASGDVKIMKTRCSVEKKKTIVKDSKRDKTLQAGVAVVQRLSVRLMDRGFGP